MVGWCRPDLACLDRPVWPQSKIAVRRYRPCCSAVVGWTHAIDPQFVRPIFCIIHLPMTISMHNGLSTLFSRYLLAHGSVGVNTDDGIAEAKARGEAGLKGCLEIFSTAIHIFMFLFSFSYGPGKLRLPACSVRFRKSVTDSCFLCFHSTRREELKP
jgi:hypothetical protein